MEITFKRGLPGFEEYKDFNIKSIEELEDFKLLKSKENEGLEIVLISPFSIELGYEVNLSEEVIKTLEVKSPEEIMLFSTVTLNEDPSKITANLKAPILVNVNNGYAEQLITENEKYKIKHPIY